MDDCAICNSPRSAHEPRALGCPVGTRVDGGVLYGPTRFMAQRIKGGRQGMSSMESLQEQVRNVLDATLSDQGYTQRDTCGHVNLFDGDIDTAELAQAVTDLLIDLAGTGRLLAAMDRIAR